jgi:serine protease inhibitor
MKRLFLQIILISFIYSQKLTFQTTLFSHLYNNPNENICISPLSIYQIVSLVSNGASGKTQDEILKALLPDSIINKKSQFKVNDINNKIVQLYNSKNKYVKIANAVMTKQKLKSVFLKMCKKYDAFVEPLTSASQVNKWCSEKTNGKINHIIG